MVVNKIRAFFKRLILTERSSIKFARSFCMGVHIAFSPFVGFHTLMVCGLSWLFRLNIAIVFAVSIFINNPWTMVPIYSFDYIFGDFLFSRLLGFNMLQANPTWMMWVNDPLTRHTGMEGISLWSFIIGGNLLAIGLGIILYPLILRIFTRMTAELNHQREQL